MRCDLAEAEDQETESIGLEGRSGADTSIPFE